MKSELFIGIDVGTSGCRAIAIDGDEGIVGQAEHPLPTSKKIGAHNTQQPADWWQSVRHTLQKLGESVDLQQVSALAVDGTSATVLLADHDGIPVTDGIMYNDTRAVKQAEDLSIVSQSITSGSFGALGATSSLAKLMWLHAASEDKDAHYFLSQSDWITGMLCRQWGTTDYNNALKLGYDVVNLQWPGWLETLPIRFELLPKVGRPGESMGNIARDVASDLGISPNATIKLGTTDSVAAFIASGAHRIGQAVTSLGSTLVLKVLSDRPVFSEKYGIYSHRLGDLWLAGGASNSGGSVLLQHFTTEEMETLTPQLKPNKPIGLNYYPLPCPGERFPINDSTFTPKLTPVPEARVDFFQALLEGMADIEHQGYERLKELGAPYPGEVLTSGGGAKNKKWDTIRQRHLGVPVAAAQSTQAAFGTALIAKGG